MLQASGRAPVEDSRRRLEGTETGLAGIVMIGCPYLFCLATVPSCIRSAGRGFPATQFDSAKVGRAVSGGVRRAHPVLRKWCALEQAIRHPGTGPRRLSPPAWHSS
jgi:hypothetical protein